MTPPRPDCVVAVLGTGTDVGKTWTTAALARGLRSNGRSVVARKPAQSFDREDATTDADVLADATGEDAQTVCPKHRWLTVPMAPPMATAVLGLEPIMLATLVDETVWPATPVDFGFVETVGGVRSPVAEDGDSLDLAAALDPDLFLLVADAGLGTIDRVRLAAESITGAPLWVFLNRFNPNEDLHIRNVDWLAHRDGFNVTTNLSELVAIL